MRRYRKTARAACKRSYLTVFKGYHHRQVIESGECFDMTNLTSDAYPLLSVRKARDTFAYLDGSSMQYCAALHGRSDHPVVVNDFGDIICHGHTLAGLLVTQEGMIPASMLPKKIVSMGAYCIIFPDKVWFNAVRLANGDTMTEGEDYGSLENETRVRKGTSGYVGYDTIRFTSVYSAGEGYIPYHPDRITYSAEPPSSPANGAYWCDNANHEATLKIYDSALGSWEPVVSSYLRITATDKDGNSVLIGKGFSAGDTVEISGLNGRNVNAEQEDPIRSQIQNLNGRHLLLACTDTELVIEGSINAAAVTEGNPSQDEDIVFSRTVPDMDFVVECGNRLWGCKYGLVNGERINEIYASKLGSFGNWNSFYGLSTDSYTASRGAEGAYTGAAVLGETPLFFRENSFEKIYPSAEGAHRIVTVTAPGIQSGSWQSAAVIDGVLYYKGADGVYAYSGSLPRCISYKLGDEPYHSAVAGSCREKYYISMYDAQEQPQLFVYDTLRGLWHREDNTAFYATAEFDGALYFEDGMQYAQKIGGVEACTNVPWMAQSGTIGLLTPDQKRIGRILLRLQLEKGAEMRIYVQYNSDGHWHEKGRMHGNSLHTVTVPIVPVRCDHMQLRLEGIGGMQLYSVAYLTQQGSDVP